jgi:hypothetical protein
MNSLADSGGGGFELTRTLLGERANQGECLDGR